MDHGVALVTKASERYLLNEMSEPERFEFEDHYFSCETCAEDVRNGEILARGVKAIGAETAIEKSEEAARRGWWTWLTPATLTPSFAAIAMTVVAGYQAFVLIPSMRNYMEPQAVEPVILRAVSRGEEPVVRVNRSNGLAVLALDVNAGEPGQAITWELQPPGGNSSFSGDSKVPPAGTQFELCLPNSRLQHEGIWTLVLRFSDHGEAGRYPFRIEIK